MENHKDLIWKGGQRLGLNLSEDQVSQFLVYLDELRRWNAKMNLTAIREDRLVIIRHFLDSLAGIRALPAALTALNHENGAHLMDVGTGAGFPGIPIKIWLSRIRLTLVEPIKKKAAFLQTICGRLKMERVALLVERIETLAIRPQYSGRYDAIVSRALSPSALLHHTAKLLRPGGRIVIWTSRPHEKPTLPKELPDGLEGPHYVTYTLPIEEVQRTLAIWERT